jgi:TATA-box binding protein (TBP) (component of TFIID and TFIIIB)
MDATDYLTREGLVNKTNPGVKVRNIVLTGSLGKTLDLASFYESAGSCIYEPEQFPAAIHHPPTHPGVSILLFQSGKFVVAGVRSFEQIEEVKCYLESISSSLILGPAKTIPKTQV